MRNRERPETTRRMPALALRLALALALPTVSLVAIGTAVAQDLSGSAAVIAQSDDGANLREEPTTEARVLATLADGTAVTLRTDEEETFVDDDGIRWLPVGVDGDDGWIASDFLADTEGDDEGEQGEVQEQQAENDDAEGEAGEPTGLVTPDLAAGQDVAVRTDDGEGLALRAGPTTGDKRVARLGEGDVVEVVDGPFWDANDEGWYLVSDGDFEAYAYGAFLVSNAGDDADDENAAGDEADAEDADENGADEASSAGKPLGLVTPDFAAGDDVAAESGDGDGVAMRAGPTQGDKRLATLGRGDVVRVVDGPFWDANDEGWYLVDDGDDFEAYVYGAFLTLAEAAADDAEAEEEEAEVEEPAEAEEAEPEVRREAAAFAAGDYAAAVTGANVRSRVSVNSRRIGGLVQDRSFQIADGPIYDKQGEDWYLVDLGGDEGYVLGDLLGAADPPSQAPQQQEGPTGGFIYPVANYTFTQAFGCTGFSFEPFDPNIGCNFHNGIDLAAPAYTPILAADGGTVTFAGFCDCGLGFYVEIDHGNGISTQYGHMAEQPYVAVGQRVNQGEVIGPMGSTGLSTGPHVHFVVEVNGVATDPLAYL